MKVFKPLFLEHRTDTAIVKCMIKDKYACCILSLLVSNQQQGAKREGRKRRIKTAMLSQHEPFSLLVVASSGFFFSLLKYREHFLYF